MHKFRKSECITKNAQHEIRERRREGFWKTLVTLTTFDLREKGKVNSEAVSMIVFKNYHAGKTDEGQSG